MKAICTKYLGPSNVRGGRYKAYDLDGNSVTISIDHATNREQNHKRACIALREKMGWSGPMVAGATKDGMAWVFSDTSRLMDGYVIDGNEKPQP